MKYLIHRVPIVVVGLLLMALFTACAGVAVPTTTNPVTVTGTVKSVDATNGSVTLTVNGQNVTINGLSSAQVAQLQSQVGKTYTIQATQNSDGSYTINASTNPVASAPGTPSGIETPNANETPNPNETPNATEPTGPNQPGSISFIGKVQSVSSSSIVVSMPDGHTLSMRIVSGQTDLTDLGGVLPSAGQLVKVQATANTDGSFLAAKLSATDSSDAQKQQVVDYQGVTTSAVGSDHVLHFKVGNQSFSFPIGSGADVGDFQNNPQSIGNNQSIKVTVQFQGTTGTVIKVSSANS